MNDRELRLYSISDAAKRLGIGKANLYKLIEKGKVGTISLNGRFKISYRELIRYIDENTIRQNAKETEIDVDNFVNRNDEANEPKEIITDEFFNKLKEAA